MIWPWSEIRYLKQQVQYWKLEATRQENWKLIHEKIAIAKCRDVLAAHKGIRRLVEKLKRARQARWATYLGASDSQVAFGRNTDPRSYLTVGRRYQVDRVVVHDSVTDVYLKDYPGKGFNSACFDLDIADDLEAWRARQRKERE